MKNRNSNGLGLFARVLPGESNDFVVVRIRIQVMLTLSQECAANDTDQQEEGNGCLPAERKS